MFEFFRKRTLKKRRRVSSLGAVVDSTVTESSYNRNTGGFFNNKITTLNIKNLWLPISPSAGQIRNDSDSVHNRDGSKPGLETIFEKANEIAGPSSEVQASPSVKNDAMCTPSFRSNFTGKLRSRRVELTVDLLQTRQSKYHHHSVLKYMCARYLDLFEDNVIPVWNPCPDLSTSSRRRISVGDVGAFQASGYFEVFFNILDRGQSPAERRRTPDRFIPLNLSDSRSEASSTMESVEPHEKGAVTVRVVYRTSKLSKQGFTVERLKAKQSTDSCHLALSASGRKGAFCIYLPYGAVRLGLYQDLQKHFEEYLDNNTNLLYYHLNRASDKSRCIYPIVISAVWLAKSFASAIYIPGDSEPENVCEATLSENEDGILAWDAHRQISTMCASDSENKRSNSEVGNQCFAIEGHIIVPQGPFLSSRFSL